MIGTASPTSYPQTIPPQALTDPSFGGTSSVPLPFAPPTGSSSPASASFPESPPEEELEVPPRPKRSRTRLTKEALRDRNRKNAASSRQRKKELVDSLKAQVSELKDYTAKLEREIFSLKKLQQPADVEASIPPSATSNIGSTGSLVFGIFNVVFAFLLPMVTTRPSTAVSTGRILLSVELFQSPFLANLIRVAEGHLLLCLMLLQFAVLLYRAQKEAVDADYLIILQHLPVLGRILMLTSAVNGIIVSSYAWGVDMPTWLISPSSAPIASAGLMIQLASVLLSCLVVREGGLWMWFGVANNDHHPLVTTGPFAFIRHPLYLSILLFYFGQFLVVWSWLVLLTFAVSAAVLVSNAIPGEEKALMITNPEYRLYKERTWQLIPFVH